MGAAFIIAALAIAGLAGASTGNAATTTELKGVTVSAAQHPGGAPIDWPKVAAAGYLPR